MTQIIRPRRGDLEAATQPHPFRASGEYVGPARVEVCDLCGLAQRGTPIHLDNLGLMPEDDSQPNRLKLCSSHDGDTGLRCMRSAGHDGLHRVDLDWDDE